VLVHLGAGRSLEESQVASITHLVAASVPGMEPRDVKVVDQHGRLLTAPERPEDAALTQSEFDHTRRLEAYYIKRIEDILSPVLGADGVRAQVAAEIDFTRSEQTRESFNPDQPALRSEQVLEESGGSGAPGGIPGALSNQPPGPASAPEQAKGGGAAGAGGDAAARSRRQATRNYEVDRTVSHTTQPGATLRKLSVAVVVDDHRSADAAGQITRRSLSPEEVERITGLVREAVGYDARRGDTLSVINVPFASPLPVAALDSGPLWEQPWVWDLARQVVGLGVVALLALLVLRPAIRRLLGEPAAALHTRVAVAGAGAGDELADDRLSLSQATGQGAAEQQRESGLTSVKALVAEDPRRVAQVIRSWMAEDG
jgi:flagellar M-ring protein FliF